MAKRQEVLPDGRVKDISTPVRLGRDPREESAGPVIDPRVTNPTARAYAERLAAKRPGVALPRYAEPVAGGPTPPIPLLNSDHIGGRTMAEQARPLTQASPGIVQGGLPSPAMSGTHSMGILPIDVLPEQAKEDPDFRQGMGGQYAAAQPHLAKKYGVIRNGIHLSPQQLWPRKERGLSPETMEGIKALEEFNKKREETESVDRNIDKKIEKEATSGVAGQGQDVRGKETRSKPLTDEERKELLSEMDEFDLTKFRDAVMRDLLNNEEQKKIIEVRLKPLDITDLIVTGRVTQTVPIILGKFEPEFQSYSGEEDLAIKRLIVAEAKSLEPSDRYLLDKYSLMGLAVSLRSVNKKQIPTHEDNDGNFDDKKFWAKFNIVVKFPFHMLASLAVNWFWFDMRVRRLFVAEQVGNG